MTRPHSPAAAVEQLLAKLPEGLSGIGLDIVEVDSFVQLLEDGGSSFVAEYWTESEQAEAANEPERLAARWAAKEAVMKAIGVGIGVIDPLDIEVRIDPESGAPRVELHASAAKAASDRRVTACYVTLTHEAGWAAALALADATGMVQG